MSSKSAKKTKKPNKNIYEENEPIKEEKKTTKSKKKKIKQLNYIDDDSLINNIIDDHEPEPEKKTTKKKKKKTKKSLTEEKVIEENKIISDNNEDDIIEKPVKKKKKKKKKKKIVTEINTEDEPENVEEEKNDVPAENEVDRVTNLDDLSIVESKKIPKVKKKKKKKKKKKIPQIESDDQNNIENDINKTRPMTSNTSNTNTKGKMKKNIEISKNNYNFYNYTNNIINDNTDIYKENIAKKDEKGKIETKGKKKSPTKKNTTLYEDLINKNPAKNTKSILNKSKMAILNSFSRKKIIKKDSDYIDYNISSKNVVEIKNKEKEEDNNSNFEVFLEKINEFEYQGYNYKITKDDYFKLREKDPPILTILNSEDAAIKKCEELMNTLGPNDKWKDPDFGPQDNDNGKGTKKSLFGDYGNAQALGVNPDYIEWNRIGEINENATFFYDGTESNDVMQGALGDCWFISALSVIATKDYLLRGEFDRNILDDGKIDEEEIKMMSEGIYPPIFHSFSSKGIYCFRFFKNFKWRYVLIDDRLPCHATYNPNQPKKLIFAHCRQDNEFWVPLIEKAYAKIHGSYYALISGCIDDGMVDMTGLVSKKILKDNSLLSNIQRIDEFWNLLMNFSSLKFENELRTQAGKKVTSKYFTRNKSMMGCSVERNGKTVEMEVSMQGHKIGIIAGHAYSILDAFELNKPRSKKSRKCSRLLRIRNPWGNYEWNGKWCDNSEEVIKNKEKIEEILNIKYADTDEKIDFSKDDGTFLMRYSDFRKIFNNIFICQNFPPSFIGVRFYDEWTKKNSGGLPLHSTREEFNDFFKNPQYFFELKKPGKVIISLLQNDGRLYGEKFPFATYVKKVCLIVFKVKNENKINEFEDRVDQTVIAQRRDISLELNLGKGSYIAIPSLKDKGVCANFYLEFYFEDELIQNTKSSGFNFNYLKYTRIKKLGEDAKCELINEYIASEMKMTSKNKLDFIMSAFQYSLKNSEEKEKMKGIKLNNDNYEDEDEDFDPYNY